MMKGPMSSNNQSVSSSDIDDVLCKEAGCTGTIPPVSE